MIKIYGKVDKIGTTSIKMYMEARSHNVYSGKQSIILSTNIKFVRIDEDGEPIPIAERVKNKFK
jgi:acyl-CoA hydrolase